MKKSLLALSMLAISLILISSFSFVISCSDDDDDTNPTATPTPTPTQNPNADIIPGEKIFELYIDDDFSTCRDKHGEPLIIRYVDYLPGYRYFIVVYYDLGLLLKVEDVDVYENLDDTDKIREISVLISGNWDGTTNGGNGLGSSLDSVKGEFGECEEWVDVICYYNSIGIKWIFSNGIESCTQVWIWSPN